MENKIMKKRFSVKLSALIVLLFVLCAGGVLTGCGKNKADSIVNNGPNVEVSDEAALREALAIKEDRVITLTADITITQELVVNGTKTISGDKSIIMNLHAIGKSQSVLSIADKGSLILDGPTIDGNGVANGISVRPGAAFKGVSGNVVYGYPYGMTIAGDAVLEGVVIDKAMHTGVYVEYGGNTDMTGGVVKDNIYGIAVASNAYMSISGSAQVIESTATLVNNYGKMVVTAGSFKGGLDNAFTNQGELTIKGTADNKIEICDSKRSAIVSKKNSKLTVSNLYIHDVGLHAVAIEKKTKAEVSDIVVEKTGASSFYVNNATIVLNNTSITDGASYGIYAQKNSDVTLENITIKNVGSRGIVNSDAKLRGTKIYIDGTAMNGIHTTGEEAVTNIENVQILNPMTNGLAVVSGKVIVKSITIDTTKNEGFYIGAGAQLEAEDVSINKSGMNSVANNGGHVKLKNIQITSSQNIAIKSTDEGTISVDGAKITDSVSHAVCVEKNSIVKVLNTEIDTTGKSSVYVANSKLTMEDTRIKNAPNYGIYAKECDKTKEQGVFLDRITIDKSNDRGIGNSNSWVVVKNTKISDTKGAAIYTEKESTITNIHELTVNTPGSCGLGLLGGTVTARNVTITNAVKEGVNIGKGTDVRLDNVTVVSPGGHGVGNYGGTLNITVDMDFNPENLLHNGLTVTDAGESGIYCGADSKTTAIGVAIENSKAHAVCAMNESYLSLKQSKIDKTGKSSVYVKASKAVLTDVAIVNSPNYGVYATACEKDKDQGAFLEGVTIDKAGERGIGNSGAWVVIKNTTINNPKGAGVYTEKESSITNIHALTVNNAGTCGLGLLGGTVTARNVTINLATAEGINIGDNTDVRLDNVTVVKPGTNGVAINGGKLTVTVDTEFNPENANGNGLTIKDSGKTALACKGNSKTTAVGVTILNSSAHGVSVEKESNLSLKNSNIDTTAKSSVYVNASKAVLTDVVIKNAPNYAVYATECAKDKDQSVVLEGVSIDKTADRGVGNVGAWVVIRNSKITNTQGAGVYTEKEDAVTNIHELLVSNTGSCGLGLLGGKVTARNLTVKNTVNEGINIGSGVDVRLDDAIVETTGTHGVANYGGTLEVTVDRTFNPENDNNNGLTIIGATENGILCAKNGVTTGNGVTIKNAKKAGIAITGGKLFVNGGHIDASVAEGVNIDNQAEVVLTDTLISKSGTNGIDVDAAAEVALCNVLINESKQNAIQNYGNVVVTAVDDGNGLSIDGVEETCGIYNKGTASFDGTNITISNVKKDGIYSEANTAVEIEDTVISNAGREGISINGNLTMANVIITNAGEDAIRIQGGVTNATGVEIINPAKKGIYVFKTADVTIDGITIINATEQAMQFAGSATVAVSNFTVDKAGKSAIYVIGNEVDVTLNKGTVSEGENGIYLEGSAVTATNVTIDKSRVAGVFVKEGTSNGLSGVEITNSVQDGICIEKTATLDLADVEIKNSTENGIINYGTLNVAGTNGLTIAGVTNTCGIYNRGNAVVNGKNITISGVAKDGILVESSATINVDNVTISDVGRDGISVSGKVTITSDNDANNGATITNAGQHGLIIQGSSANVSGIEVIGSAKKGLYVKGTKNVVIDGVVITNPGAQAMQFSGKATGTVSNFAITTSGTTANASVYVSDAETNMNFVNGQILSYKQGLYADSNTTITATDVSITRLEGSTSPLVVVNTGANLTLNETETNKSVIDGNGLDARGVEVIGTFTLNGGTITGNKVTTIDKKGAGVYVSANANFVMNGGSVSGNELTNSTVAGGYAGAGVYVGEGATFTLAGGSVSDNIANASGKNTYGAGISVEKGTLNMTGGSILRNDIIESSANSYGAGVALSDATFTMSGGEISDNGNAAINAGGAVSINASSVFNFTGGKIQRNTANNGGAIHANSGSMTISGNALLGGESAADGNVAKENGGAIWFATGFNLTMNGGKISYNTATKKGGAMYVQKSSTVTLNAGEISGNISTTRTHGIDSDSTSSKSTVIISAGFVLSDTIYTTNITVTDNR